MIWKSFLVTMVLATNLVYCKKKGDMILMHHGKCSSPTIVKTGGKKGGDTILMGGHHGNCETEVRHHPHYIPMPYPVTETVRIPVPITIRERIPYPVYIAPPPATNHYHHNQYDHYHNYHSHQLSQTAYDNQHYIDNIHTAARNYGGVPGTSYQDTSYTHPPSPPTVSGYTAPGQYQSPMQSYSASLNNQSSSYDPSSSATGASDYY